jgi:hypothetical protein
MRRERGRPANLVAKRRPRSEIGTVATRAPDTFPYPQGNVVGILTDVTAFDEARTRLERSGFEAGGYEVLHGEESLARIDVEGSAHGRLGNIARRLQAALGDEGDHARHYTEHLRAGHYVVGVKVGEDETAKRRAADALLGAHAEFVKYYAENYVEDLDN